MNTTRQVGAALSADWTRPERVQSSIQRPPSSATIVAHRPAPLTSGTNRTSMVALEVIPSGVFVTITSC